MNLYAEDLKAILRYMEALGGAERDIGSEPGIFPLEVPLANTEDPGYSMGKLVEADGLGWSWVPPGQESS